MLKVQYNVTFFDKLVKYAVSWKPPKGMILEFKKGEIGKASRKRLHMDLSGQVKKSK